MVCWIKFEDIGPTLYKSYTDVLCLLGGYHNELTWLTSQCGTSVRSYHRDGSLLILRCYLGMPTAFFRVRVDRGRDIWRYVVQQQLHIHELEPGRHESSHDVKNNSWRQKQSWPTIFWSRKMDPSGLKRTDQAFGSLLNPYNDKIFCIDHGDQRTYFFYLALSFEYVCYGSTTTKNKFTPTVWNRFLRCKG